MPTISPRHVNYVSRDKLKLTIKIIVNVSGCYNSVFQYVRVDWCHGSKHGWRLHHSHFLLFAVPWQSAKPASHGLCQVNDFLKPLQCLKY